MENPELPMFDVEKAMKALQDYTKELEDMKCEGLTQKQAKALVRFEEELISPIESET
jgi:hypothetical protein